MKYVENKSGKLHYLGSILPFMLMLSFIFGIYCLYAYTYMIPLINGTYVQPKITLQGENKLHAYLIQMQELNDQFFDPISFGYNKGVILAVFIHPLLLLVLISIYRVNQTSAGNVPKHWIEKITEEIQLFIQNENLILNECKKSKKQDQNILSRKKGSSMSDSTRGDDEQVKDIVSYSMNSEVDEDLRAQLNFRAMMEFVDRQGRRYCKNCQSFKPPRTHHCRQCQNCWLKMDHHCQWLNTCIGLKNYKLFLNLLCYIDFTLIFIVFSYARCFADIFQSIDVSDLRMFMVSFTFLFSFLTGIIGIAFLSFHLWILMIDKTSLEFCEGKKVNNDGDQKSIFRNFIDVFGSNPFVWFLPIQPTLEDPTYF